MSTGEVFAYRLDQNTKEIDKLDREKAEKEDVNHLFDQVREVRDELAGLRKTIIVASLTVTGSAVLFALTVFALVQPS